MYCIYYKIVLPLHPQTDIEWGIPHARSKKSHGVDARMANQYGAS